MNIEEKIKYYGYTYPSFLQKSWILKLWKKYMCSKGMHLWDEIAGTRDHYLYCDACETELYIDDKKTTNIIQENKQRQDTDLAG